MIARSERTNIGDVLRIIAAGADPPTLRRAVIEIVDVSAGDRGAAGTSRYRGSDEECQRDD
jgi:hypothetical protein